MLKRLYRVYLGIENVDLVLGGKEEVEQHLECATFSTLEEARHFCTEIARNHCPCVTGEDEILDEMSAKAYTAGD